jgi:hypothetical protein
MDLEVCDETSCDWTWDVSPKEVQSLLTFLSELAELTWAEIEAQRTGGRHSHKKHHSYAVDQLSSKARQRLWERVSDESVTHLFRFRYGGTQRLWGIRDRAMFKMVWLDLKHQVYPTEPH